MTSPGGPARLVLCKLGGSAITDKTRAATPRPEILHRAAHEIGAALAADPRLQLVLGHGSGSFGHLTAHRSGFGEPGNWRAYAETGAAAARLNRLVTDIFLEAGLPVVSLQPSASALCRDGELIHLEIAPVRALLDRGAIPLVYGDVALDETREMSIASTEKIFAYLAPRLGPARLVYVSEVDAIYTADPVRDPQARPVPEITPEVFERVASGVGGSRSVDVTGGMVDKVRRNLALAQQLPGLDIFVIGTQPGLLTRALLDPDFAGGTRIYAP